MTAAFVAAMVRGFALAAISIGVGEHKESDMILSARRVVWLGLGLTRAVDVPGLRTSMCQGWR